MTPPLAPSRHVASDPPDPRSRLTVSQTSAERFAARVRARRRRQRLVGVLVVLFVALLVWAVLWSPPARVGTVTVTGTQRVDLATVLAVADAEAGRPMLLARTGDVAARIRADQPLVRDVAVTRDWPSTLRVTVTERVPVAAVPAGRGLHLVDTDGVVVDKVGADGAPKGMPRVEVALRERGGVEALRACVAVAQGLPPELARITRRVGATTPDRVWLQLAGGAKVDWGSEADTPRKADVLLALLPQRASSYDVRSPGTPAVRR